MKKIELLAPAKNIECGIAAINCGADAVYIGAGKFGARSSVGNDIRDIEELISYAHRYHARVYITINTILNDNEIIEAQKLIYNLHNIGADAIIVQDMGLLEIDLPPVSLFASTQTHNNTWEKVEFLERVGFERVILARELSLDQIKEIKAKTNVDLEFFVQGALCVCYSGQCYLSYAIGGRSGNRGECAQPCRKPYSLMDSTGKVISQNKYLLSLKDLNLSEYIKDLLDAGISSFKIEGRLKDIDYIKNIVSFYRQKIDQQLANSDLERSSSGKSIITFNPDPYKSFNRGFCDYFLTGRKKEIISFDTPKSTGEPVGKVISVDKTCFALDSKIMLNNGDGICFFDESGTLCGTNINKVEKNIIYPNDIKHIKKDTFIYRNMDQDFLKTINSRNPERKISIKLRLFERNNELILHSIDEDGISAEETIQASKEIAKNTEMALDNIKKQLIKFGDTEFECSEIEVNLDNIYFIPVKALNEARRAVAEKLRAERLRNYPVKTAQIKKNDYPYPEKYLDYHGNVLNDYAKSFYSRHGVIDVEPAAESGIGMQGKKVMTTKHCLKYHFDLCPKQKPASNAKEPLFLTDSHGKKYKLDFNCKNCEMEIIF